MRGRLGTNGASGFTLIELMIVMALVVVALVAIPAAREGDTLLTVEGQERVADTVTAARDKVSSSR